MAKIDNYIHNYIMYIFIYVLKKKSGYLEIFEGNKTPSS